EMTVGHLLEKSAGRAQQRSGNVGPGENQETPKSDQGGEHHTITGQPRGKPEGLAALDAVQAGIANQPAPLAHFVHDAVAGVDAGGAMDAFHLRAIADVDAGGADGDALAALDAIAGPAGLPLFEGLTIAQRPALFAAFKVVRDDNAVLVEQRGLQAAVRANEGAGLFTEAGENGIKQQRK